MPPKFKGDKAFRWYGGKGQIAHKIIDLMPPHRAYVEGCAGSASILMSKQPSELEVLNDMNGDLVNFYRVLRDPDQCAQLIHLCEYTPYSREEFNAVREIIQSQPDPDWSRDNPVLRAWTWFVWTAQSYSPGHGRNTFGVQTVRDWMASCSKLEAIGRRLQPCIIENGDWSLVADTYDFDTTLLYLDPPYLIETRSDKGDHYAHEMNTVDHMKLIRRVLSFTGMVMVSGHHHDLYNRYLVDENGWEVREFKVNTIANKSRIDVLWSSPDAVAGRQRKQQSQLGFDLDEATAHSEEWDKITAEELQTLEKMKDLLGDDFALSYAGERMV